MNNLLLISQGVIAILIVILILLQQRGTALGSAFGSSSEAYSTKRGAQKTISYITVFLTIVFIGLAVCNLIF